MKSIDLGENRVGSDGVACLLRCLHNLRILELDNNQLRGDDIAVLGSAVKKMKHLVS